MDRTKKLFFAITFTMAFLMVAAYFYEDNLPDPIPTPITPTTPSTLTITLTNTPDPNPAVTPPFSPPISSTPPLYNGMACVGSAHGADCLKDGKWQEYDALSELDSLRLQDNNTVDMAICDNGIRVFIGKKTVDILIDGEFRRYNNHAWERLFKSTACANDTILVVHSSSDEREVMGSEVTYFDNGQWFDTGATLPEWGDIELEVDPFGRAWLLSSRTVKEVNGSIEYTVDSGRLYEIDFEPDGTPVVLKMMVCSVSLMVRGTLHLSQI